MPNDAIKFLSDINTTQKTLKTVALVAVAAAAFTCIVAVAIATARVRQAAGTVYVLNEGAAMEANRADNKAQRDLEVINHVTRFHELFFNIAPNLTMINQNTARALELADESAYKYFNDLKEQRYYSTLININATQQIYVDSVKVDVAHYPYRAVTFASLYVVRETTATQYAIKTSCELTNVVRTPKNPNGLMMHKFYATKPELIETRNRN